MEPMLLLVHRIPFPPNKGDKVRSHHLLRFLATRYRVHLGTFVDHPDDLAHIPALAAFCASHVVVTLNPCWAKLRSTRGFLTNEALTLPYYRSPELRRWVDRTVADNGIRKAVVFSGAMAQYVRGLHLHVVVDFVDVDSAKWAQFAERLAWPMSLVYRREGRKLLSFEHRTAESSAASVFVTRGEAELFLSSAPEYRSRVHVIENGVNSDFFSPQAERESPYTAKEAAIVFTGSMDYWPNIDAVIWFTTKVLPLIVRERPDARFYIVGMNPARAVRELALHANVVVTGQVPDVRPYVQHASVVVAPLRVARGIQNKILEAMAMARPVIVSSVAARGVAGTAGIDFEEADESSEFGRKVLSVLSGNAGESMGQRARLRIRSGFNWELNMRAFDDLLMTRKSAAASSAQ